MNCSTWLSVWLEETDYRAKWRWTSLSPDGEMRPNRGCRWMGGKKGMLEEDEEQVKSGVTRAFLFFTLTFFTWEKNLRADDLTTDATNKSIIKTLDNRNPPVLLQCWYSGIHWFWNFFTPQLFKCDFNETRCIPSIHFVCARSIYSEDTQTPRYVQSDLGAALWHIQAQKLFCELQGFLFKND